MIPVTQTISIDESELTIRFVRSSGPGGQHVNKVATAAQLRFDVIRSPSLTEPVRARLVALAGRRMTSNGILVITARRSRSQDRNRQDAIERLTDLIRRAAAEPTRRRPTRKSRASQERRLKAKRLRGQTKRLRGRNRGDD